jgi:predicted tellurium resistance membrane protein TerC
MKKSIQTLYFRLSVACLFLLTHSAIAQNGNGVAGIEAASNQVSDFFESGVTLMYAIGAIVGLVGAVKVFNKWNSGDPDTGKVAAAWFGSCVFLVIVSIVLQSFFGAPATP